jgi:hypothetical protein
MCGNYSLRGPQGQLMINGAYRDLASPHLIFPENSHAAVYSRHSLLAGALWRSHQALNSVRTKSPARLVWVAWVGILYRGVGIWRAAT